jgi:hypothetical protein
MLRERFVGTSLITSSAAVSGTLPLSQLVGACVMGLATALLSGITSRRRCRAVASAGMPIDRKSGRAVRRDYTCNATRR